jgi:hypothetical protein
MKDKNKQGFSVLYKPRETLLECTDKTKPCHLPKVGERKFVFAAHLPK